MTTLLAGAGLLVRSPRLGKRLVWLAIGGLFLISCPPLAYLFAQPLERRYQGAHGDYTQAGAGAIVVLASNVFPADSVRPYPLVDRDTYARTEYAAWIQHHLPGTPVLACGGLGQASPVPFSRTMAHVLEGEGVPRDRIWTEERSRSTYENAVYATQILRDRGIRRIILVTEGYHMLRSEKVFRKQGLDVVAAPCNFTTFEPDSVEGWLPTWKAVFHNERTLHEAIGLLWYGMRGRL